MNNPENFRPCIIPFIIWGIEEGASLSCRLVVYMVSYIETKSQSNFLVLEILQRKHTYDL